MIIDMCVCQTKLIPYFIRQSLTYVVSATIRETSQLFCNFANLHNTDGLINLFCKTTLLLRYIVKKNVRVWLILSYNSNPSVFVVSVGTSFFLMIMKYKLCIVYFSYALTHILCFNVDVHAHYMFICTQDYL